MKIRNESNLLQNSDGNRTEVRALAQPYMYLRTHFSVASLSRAKLGMS